MGCDEVKMKPVLYLQVIGTAEGTKLVVPYKQPKGKGVIELKELPDLVDDGPFEFQEMQGKFHFGIVALDRLI